MGMWAEEVQAVFSCKEIIVTLSGVCVGLSGVIVAMAKAGWNHALEDNRIAREREGAMNVTMTAALKKKGESPK